jgi:cell division septation protein DedD
MARRGSRGVDRVLESRHLIGLFVGVVILCAVFFSLGYVMGRSQYAAAVQAAYAPGRGVVVATDREKLSPREITPAPAGDWDIYANKNNNQLEKPAPAAKVAAVMRQGDALAMADALQRKKFPSFVVAPSTDNFYRVQVGPYPDEHAADNAKSALDRAGFKAIVKR